MYQLYVSNQAKRDLKRFDKAVIKKLILILEEIAENPYTGDPLKEDLSHLRKWSFTQQGTGYRIAYQIYEDLVEVRILQVGTKENFYDELKRRK